jgi:hypothetical protein
MGSSLNFVSQIPIVPAAGPDGSGTITNHHSPFATYSTPHPVESGDLCRIGRPAQLPHHLGIAFEGFRQREVLVGVLHQLHVTSP